MTEYQINLFRLVIKTNTLCKKNSNITLYFSLQWSINKVNKFIINNVLHYKLYNIHFVPNRFTRTM